MKKNFNDLVFKFNNDNNNNNNIENEIIKNLNENKELNELNELLLFKDKLKINFNFKINNKIINNKILNINTNLILKSNKNSLQYGINKGNIEENIFCERKVNLKIKELIINIIINNSNKYKLTSIIIEIYGKTFEYEKNNFLITLENISDYSCKNINTDNILLYFREFNYLKEFNFKNFKNFINDIIIKFNYNNYDYDDNLKSQFSELLKKIIENNIKEILLSYIIL
jgi:hypothetical protein